MASTGMPTARLHLMLPIHGTAAYGLGIYCRKPWSVLAILVVIRLLAMMQTCDGANILLQNSRRLLSNS
jgi:hypothetical protein